MVDLNITFTGHQAKHTEIQAHIIKAIQNHTLNLGDRLPPEDQLSKELGVSKAVVRQAYQELTKEGWIRRSPKQGLIVFPDLSSHTFSTKLQSIGYDIQAIGLTPSMHLLNSSILSSQDFIEDYGPTEKLLKVSRLIKADHISLFVMDSYYSLDRFPSLEKQDLEHLEFFKFFQQEYNIQIKSIQRFFTPMKMPKESAILLSVSADTPCFKVISIAKDQDNQCVEYGISYALGDHFSIELN